MSIHSFPSEARIHIKKKERHLSSLLEFSSTPSFPFQLYYGPIGISWVLNLLLYILIRLELGKMLSFLMVGAKRRLSLYVLVAVVLWLPGIANRCAFNTLFCVLCVFAMMGHDGRCCHSLLDPLSPLISSMNCLYVFGLSGLSGLPPLHHTCVDVLFCLFFGERLQQAIQNKPVFVLFIIQSVCTPLQGFLNSIVYGLRRKVRQEWAALLCCRCCPCSTPPTSALGPMSTLGSPPLQTPHFHRQASPFYQHQRDYDDDEEEEEFSSEEDFAAVSASGSRETSRLILGPGGSATYIQ